MRERLAAGVLAVLSAASMLAAAGACGSRTGLFAPYGEPLEASVDAPEEVDASADVAPEPPGEAEDAIPPLDTFVPPDHFTTCPDAGATLIYVISEQNVLMSFDPPTASFTTIGTIDCPDPGSQPFSMAVDRAGIAYVVFTPSGNLFRVSTATAGCKPTAYVPSGSFSTTFGMAFVADTNDPGETLYVASDSYNSPLPPTLGTIDPMTFQLTPGAPLDPRVQNAELTGTGAGQLYTFYAVNGGADSAIGAVDKMTGRLLGQAVLTGVSQGSGWAFGFWGGDFYTFTAPDGANSIVTRFRPSDGSIVQVATTPGLIIVGAGVSTCAPQQ